MPTGDSAETCSAGYFGISSSQLSIFAFFLAMDFGSLQAITICLPLQPTSFPDGRPAEVLRAVVHPISLTLKAGLTMTGFWSSPEEALWQTVRYCASQSPTSTFTDESAAQFNECQAKTRTELLSLYCCLRGARVVLSLRHVGPRNSKTIFYNTFAKGGPGAVRHPDAKDKAFEGAYEVGPHTLLCIEASFPNMQQEVEQGKIFLGKKECATLVEVDSFNDVTTDVLGTWAILFSWKTGFLDSL